MGLFDDDRPPVREPDRAPEPSRGRFDDEPSSAPSPPPVVPNKPFGELKPYTPSWREWIGNKGQDALMALGADPYVAGHLAHGVRDIGMATPLGVPVSGLDVQHYAGQGQYGQAAVNALGLVPAGPVGRAAVTEGTGLAKRLPTNFGEATGPNTITSEGKISDILSNYPREVFSRPPEAPSSRALQGKGSAGFQDYRDTGAPHTNPSIAALAADMKTALNKAGNYDLPGASNVSHGAIDKLLEKTKTQPFITAQDLDEFRLATSAASKKGDAGAMQARSLLYDYLNKTGDTKMATAVSDYGAGKRGEIVDTVLSKSASRADPDKALANQLRSTVEKLDKRPRGFNEAEVEALDAAREGSRGVRALEGGANLLVGQGASGAIMRGGPISAGMGYVGNMFGGPVGGAIGFALPGTAAGAMRMGAGSARRGAAEAAGDLVRQRSPLYQEMQAASARDPLYYPGVPSQNFVMRNAITQAIIDRNRRP